MTTNNYFISMNLVRFSVMFLLLRFPEAPPTLLMFRENGLVQQDGGIKAASGAATLNAHSESIKPSPRRAITIATLHQLRGSSKQGTMNRCEVMCEKI
jgi:hypothetical protein